MEQDDRCGVVGSRCLFLVGGKRGENLLLGQVQLALQRANEDTGLVFRETLELLNNLGELRA